MSVPIEPLSPAGGGGEWNASLAGDYLWTNTNFGEAVSEVMTPLSWSVLRLVLRDWSFLPGYETPGNIGGRPYLNVSVLATVFQALGRSQEDLLATIGNLLYMRLPEGMDIPIIPTARGAVFSILPNALRIQVRQMMGVRHLPGFLAANPAWFRATRRQIREAATGDELRSLWHSELEPHVTRNVWPILGSASHASDYALRLHHDLAELVGPEDASLLTSSLSQAGGANGDLLASLGPVTGLARLAQGEMERADYLEQYGHRGPHEFELSVPRPAEDPAWLDQQLAHFEAPAGVETMLAGQRAASEAAWVRFETRYPRQARGMKRRLDEAARRARQREAARSEYVRDRWAVRLFALRAAELTGIGDDVFFLTMDDLLALLSGDRQPLDRVPDRRAWYRRYKDLPPYPALIRGAFDPFRWAQDPDRRTDLYDGSASTLRPTADRIAGRIAGSPGSAGQVEGSVRRIDRPEDGGQLLPGEILVTVQTDIAWTLLFPRAGAIVTDVGATLSHAAIVARELGIPAVVGCGDATLRLKTGDRVRVDGTHGTVQVLSPAEPAK